MTNDEAQKPKYDLDLDAAEIEVQLADGTKPRRFGKGPSVGEIIELGKKDPATLTPTQKKQLEEANETMGKFVERMAPSLASFGDMARRLTESVRVPNFSRQMTEVSLPPIIPPASGVEQHKQTMLLQRLVETFEAQTAERDADLHQAIQPRYDAQKRLLIFSNTLIEIPENTDQENLCQVLFRAGRPVKKPVELGDALTKMGVPLDQIKGNKKVHSAKQALNDRVEKATQLKELLVIENKKVWFNPRYT